MMIAEIAGDGDAKQARICAKIEVAIPDECKILLGTSSRRRPKDQVLRSERGERTEDTTFLRMD